MVTVVFTELKFLNELFPKSPKPFFSERFFPDCYFSQNKKFKNFVIRRATVTYFINVLFYTYN